LPNLNNHQSNRSTAITYVENTPVSPSNPAPCGKPCTGSECRTRFCNLYELRAYLPHDILNPHRQLSHPWYSPAPLPNTQSHAVPHGAMASCIDVISRLGSVLPHAPFSTTTQRLSGNAQRLSGPQTTAQLGGPRRHGYLGVRGLGMVRPYNSSTRPAVKHAPATQYQNCCNRQPPVCKVCRKKYQETTL